MIMKSKLSFALIIAFLITSVLYLPSFAGSTKVLIYSDVDIRYEDASKVFSPQYNPFLFNPKNPQKSVLKSIKPFDNSKPITNWSNIETVPNFMNNLMKLFPVDMVKERFMIHGAKNYKDTCSLFGLKSEVDYAYLPKNPVLNYQYAKNVQIVPWTMQMLEPKPMTRRDMAVLLARVVQYFSPLITLSIDTSSDGAMTTQGKNEIENPPFNQSDFGNFGLSMHDAFRGGIGFPLFYTTDVIDDNVFEQWQKVEPSLNAFLENENRYIKEYVDQFKLFKAIVYPELPNELKKKYDILFDWKAYRGNFKDLYTIQPADVSACVFAYMTGLMDTKNGYFKPYDFVSKQEAQQTINRMQKLIQKMYKLNLKEPWGYLDKDSNYRRYPDKSLVTPIFHTYMGLGGNWQYLSKETRMRMEEARKKKKMFFETGAIVIGDAFQQLTKDRLQYIWNFDFRPDLKKVSPPPIPKPKNKNILYVNPYIPVWFYDTKNANVDFLGRLVDHHKLFSGNKTNKTLGEVIKGMFWYWRIKGIDSLPSQCTEYILPLVWFNVDYRNIDKEMPVRTEGHAKDDTTYLHSKYSLYALNLGYRDWGRSMGYVIKVDKKRYREYEIDTKAIIQNRINTIKKYKIVSEAHVYYSPSCPSVGLLRIIYYPPTDPNWLKSKGMVTGKWYDIYYATDGSTPVYLYSLDYITNKLRFSSEEDLQSIVGFRGIFLDQ